MKHVVKIAKLGDKEIVLESGKIAKQADGSIWIRQRDSVVLVTAVSAKEKKEGLDFFPLTVDYQEKLSASGRIPGSFFRREGRPTEKETLSSRIIDRSCRPLFPKGYQNETQIIATVLSFDPDADTDVLALTGASAALTASDIPFNGPIGGVRVVRVDGRFVANPTNEEREKADLEIVVAASRDAIVMVEGGAAEVPEDVMVEALLFAQQAVQPLIEAQLELARELGKTEKRPFEPPAVDEELRSRFREVAWGPIAEAYAISEKAQRYAALSAAKKAALEAMKEQLGEAYALHERELKGYFEDFKYEYMRKMIVEQGVRIAGRKPDEIRSIWCEVGSLPRAHGSSIFTRGETQAICTATLGTGEDEQRIESLMGMRFKRFMLHYNFPPYSVGEVRFLRAPGRREIGHGALAERALRYVMPSEEEFPYVIRVTSDIAESNGSSSMATVCGGTLALMDAGVPIKAPVAGIAMGLIKEGDKVVILSDILGDEDHLGDMDFKVCGTRKGITSIQMDIKITGVTKEILQAALEQARQGRLFILDKMAEVLPEPRKEISRWAPRITTIKIRPERIKDVIGPGGKTVRDIINRTGCSIDIQDDGTINIASPNQAKVEEAIQMIRSLTQEAEIGKTYLGTVRRIVEFGAFVELFPGTDGLIHISELSDQKVKNVSDVLSEGDEVLVKVVSIDRQGKIRLSRKEALRDAGNGANPPTKVGAKTE